MKMYNSNTKALLTRNNITKSIYIPNGCGSIG